MGKKIFGNMAEKRKLAYKLADVRPANMTMHDLVHSPDLQYISGEFSTFDKTVSDLLRRGEIDKCQQYMFRRISNGQSGTHFASVVYSYAKLVNEICQRHTDLMRDALSAGCTGDVGLWQVLFSAIANDLNAVYKSKKHVVDVLVVDSWADAGFDEKEFEDTLGYHIIYKFDESTGIMHCKIIVNRMKIISLRTGGKSNPDILAHEMMAIFAHEYMHFIDASMPNHGPLGAQFAHASSMIDDKDDFEKYKKNPQEVSALLSERYLRDMLDNFDR